MVIDQNGVYHIFAMLSMGGYWYSSKKYEHSWKNYSSKLLILDARNISNN